MSARRIVLVVTDFPSPSETFILRKAVGLIGAGVDVHVACTRSRASDLNRLPAEERKALAGRVAAAWPRRPRALALACLPLAAGGCLLRNPAGTIRYLRRSWKERDWRSVSDLYRDAAIVRLAPSVIHFEFAALAAERPTIARHLGCRMTTSLRGYDMAHTGLDAPDHYAEVWSAVDAVHVLGDHLRRLAARRGLPASKPVYSIPPALSVTGPGHGDRATEGSAPVRLLSVGRAHWTKGYEYALLAARELARRGIDFRYRIVGGGPEIEALHLARHQLDLQDRLEILGMLRPDEVVEELAATDIFVHASVTEGFGNSVLEAQAMGVPVVTSDAGGLRENVEAGCTGIVVPRRDPGALADAIEALAGDPGKRRAMGRQGRERAASRFALDDQIAAFDAMYSEVLAAS